MRSPAIKVRDLRFRYRKPAAGRVAAGDVQGRLVLDGVDLEVPAGIRCLVIGANGAGKTTLLRILGGKHMVPHETVQVLGSSAFHDTDLVGRVELLGGNFPFAVDIRVGEVVDHVIGADPGRRDALIDLLGVDLDWHMHAVSDGQRRRVQLLLGLMRPAELLLLDEVTTDLDLLARQDLLAFLRHESEDRGCTILYATHIFDSLDEWATHLLYMVAGKIVQMSALSDIPELTELRAAGKSNPLLHLVDRWLRRDRDRAGHIAAT